MSAPAQRLSRRTFLSAALLLVLHAALLVLGARAAGPAADESNYFNSGRIVLRHGWVHPATLFQGPVALYANQAFVGEFPSGGLRDFAAQRELAFRGRLGTLPFALLGLALVFAWARRLFGEGGALLALLLVALNPLLVGYGSLMLVDVQHAATVLLVLYLLARALESRSVRHLPALGLALGVALAVKYLAVLLALCVGASVGLAALSGGPPRAFGRRLAHAAAALGLVVVPALAALHAAYLFRGGFAPRDAEPYRSELVRELVERPVVGPALALLPAPFLRGVDYQLGQSEMGWRPFLNGRFAERQPTIYLWAFLCKTPEVALACLALALILGLRGLLGGRAPPGWRAAALACGPYALVLLVFLGASPMQPGIRYALPLVPLLCLASGALLARPSGAPPGARTFVLLGLLGALLARELAGTLPDGLAYHNRVSGGQRLAFRRFRDTNNDFGQHDRDGPALLRARHGEVQVLGPLSGARFGQLAVDNTSLRYQPGAPDGYALTWLTWLEPLDHVAASWWLFELTPEAFEREVERAPALRRELALAYLARGERARAEVHLAQLAPAEAAPLHAVVAAEDEVARVPSAAALEALIHAWRALARPDRALAVAEAHAAVLGDSDAVALARVEALEEARDFAGAARALARPWRDPAFPARLRRVQLLWEAGDFEQAALVLAEIRAQSSRADSPAFLRLAQQIALRTSFWELVR